MAGFGLVPAGSGQNYTGMLTRSIVFSGALFVFLAATGMTLAAIIVPNWVSFDNTTDHGSRIHYTYGLSKRCTSTTTHSFASIASLECFRFPANSDCHGDNRYFCSMWRSVGFLMSFAVVIEGMTICAFVVLLSGGKQRREQGWGVLAILAAVGALIQAAAMSIITYLFENDERFIAGWFLDKSWILCTVSWAVQAVAAAAVTAAALLLPTEGGYELIPDFG